ncbi:Translocation complex component [Trichophyton interdigitale]|uniref:Translocation complex component n=1 Tax=Trichophyton interdigitale TaxID=101480 RepID=A0A9P4YIX8_9EURO|nr:Translocation complex component [Trichophyton interdigitale]KAF3900100.1 Translocation complex component [Trichophyton interdigitale]KAG8208593.1 Translocation complex component [Trichophyton interdigitale]
MSTDYNYDEQGQFFPFFILTLTGLVTLPLTYTLLRPVKGLENSAPRIKSDFKPQHDDIIQSQKQKLLRKERRIKRIITVIVGYAVMAWMVYLITVTARSAPKIWDPYEILGISRSADERAISKHYKRLSVKFHPDKIKPDPAKNETVEMLNERFVELTKAYKTLTDEEIRNNYIQFGHPDGKQSFSIGIALPKFIVTEGNGKFVLLLYGILFGVLLPYTVGRWWYGNQRYTKDNVLVASAGNLFREYKPGLTGGDMISTMSIGDEYTELLNGDHAHSGLAKIEKKILESVDMSPKNKLALSKLDDEKRRKALALLWAYLGRVDLEDNTLNNEKFQVAPPAVTLNNAFTTIALAFGNLQPIMTSLYTSQNLIQAIAPNSSPLLQLPYFTPDVVRSVEGEHSKTHMTIQQFMKLPEVKRRSMTIGSGLLTDSQYQTAVSVARRIPALELCKAVLRVQGEKVITPSSLVQLVVKARFVPPGCEYVPPVKESDLVIEDIDEDAIADAQTGNATVDPKEKEKKTLSEKEDEPEIQPPLAHAPYFARDHSPRWHIFLADVKQDRMAVPPFTFTKFDKPIFDDEGKPTFNVQTMKMQFQAPPQAGSFPFVLNIVCDSYIGFDQEQEITLEVADLEKAAAIAQEDDISEPDEDSIAGQMQALKTGQAPPKKKRVAESSEDDESDTDGDAADDTSETDTETDTDGE